MNRNDLHVLVYSVLPALGVFVFGQIWARHLRPAPYPWPAWVRRVRVLLGGGHR